MLAEVQAVGRDVTELRRAMDELGAARERLQGLSRRLLEVQESERKSLARELHDDIGQSLTALKLNLEALQRGRKGAALAYEVALTRAGGGKAMSAVLQIAVSGLEANGAEAADRGERDDRFVEGRSGAEIRGDRMAVS